MRDENDAYRVHLNAGSGQAPEEPEPGPGGPRLQMDTPFCLGILGDFSGRGREDANDPVRRSPTLTRVTPDNVLRFAGLSPTLTIRGTEGQEVPEKIRISSFDGFHPDHLFKEVAGLEPLRAARQRILNGERGGDGDAAVGAALGPSGPPATEPPGAGASTTGLLDAVLDETREEMASSRGDILDDDLDGFIRRVVRPHVLPSDSHREEALDTIDGRASALLNLMIHDPGFQALESLWRSVVFLLSRIEVTSNLRVYLVDVSRSDLESDLLGTDEPSEWSLGGLFFNPVSEHGEALRWAALVGAYSFGGDPEDIPLLQRIGFLCEAAEVPWFSRGDSALFGCASLAATPEPEDWTEPLDPRWTQLRGNPEAAWLSLTFPDFLLRSPYEPKRSSTGSLPFLEVVEGPDHLLWGNPAFLPGIRIAGAFSRSGWALRPWEAFSVENVPVHTLPEGWASPLQAALSQRAAGKVRDSGLTPVLALRNESAIRIQGIQSISGKQRGVRAWWRENP